MMPGRGMTLLEIMVAMVIVAILMTLLLTIHVGAMRVRRRTEDVTEMNARARGAFDLLRRDLQGAFPLADELPSSSNLFAEYQPGKEFLWRSPTGGDYKGLSFFAATDGARNRLADPLWPFEHDTVSWAVRGGSLVRQIGQWPLSASFTTSTPGGGTWKTVGTNPGVNAGEQVYSADDVAVFQDVGAYAGCVYLRPPPDDDLPALWPLQVTHAAGPLPVTVTLAFDEDRADFPGWANEFTELEDTIEVNFLAAGTTTFRLYGRACRDGKFTLGPNGDPMEKMYFVILEPLSWSLGESAESLVFTPPPAPPTGNYTIVNGKGAVPEYVDVTLTISDPEAPDPALRLRRFGERIWIPVGGGM